MDLGRRELNVNYACAGAELERTSCGTSSTFSEGPDRCNSLHPCGSCERDNGEEELKMRMNCLPVRNNDDVPTTFTGIAGTRRIRMTTTTTMKKLMKVVVVMVCVLSASQFVVPTKATEVSQPRASTSTRVGAEGTLDLRTGASSRYPREMRSPLQLQVQAGEEPRRRHKRQVLYFVLNFLGEEAIRSYVAETKTEDIPSLMTSVDPENILYIVQSLPPEEIMRVLTSIPAQDVLKLARRMTQDQLTQLLGLVPRDGLAKLTQEFSPDQLQTLVMMMPPEGIVNLTKTIPPHLAKKLLRSMSPEGIFNLTQSMAPRTLVELMGVLPPDIVLDLAETLPPQNLDRLLRSLPPDVLVTMITSLPSDVIKKLIKGLPPGFVEAFLNDLTPNALSKMVSGITAEQVVKLLTSFPAGYAPDVSRLLQKDMVGAALTALPADLLSNLTSLLPPRKMAAMLAAVTPERLRQVLSAVSADQLSEIMRSIPPEALGQLLTSIPAHTLLSLSYAVPLDLIVNLTVSLAQDQEALSQLLSSLLSPSLVSKLSSSVPVPAGLPFSDTEEVSASTANDTDVSDAEVSGGIAETSGVSDWSLPKDLLFEVLDKLPQKTIGQMMAAVPVRRGFEVASILLRDTSAHTLDNMLKAIPTPLLVKVVNAAPPEVIAQMAEQLSRTQLKKIIRHISPTMVNLLMTSMSPTLMVQTAQAMPESVVTSVLTQLPPSRVSKLVRAVPLDTIRTVLDIVLKQDPATHSSDALLTTTQKISNILQAVPPDTLTRLIKAVPRDVLLSVMDSLPAELLAEGAAVLSGEEGVPLLSSLPMEALAYFLTVLPPESFIRIVDALPRRTIGAFANMLMKVPQERVVAFFGHLQVQALRNILIKLPPRTVEKLASSLPPGTLGKMVKSFSPVTVAPIMESLRPKELRRLIRSVNATTLNNLLKPIPMDVLVNLTQALPPDQMGKLLQAIPPELINQLVSSMDPRSMVALMKSLPPAVIQNLLNAMPQDLLVNMTKMLPPAQMQELMDLLPGDLIGRMVSILPKDVLVDLVQTFDADAMLGMMSKLSAQQLMDILSTLPPQVVLNITKSQTPEQTLKLLRTLPPEGILELTSIIPMDIMLQIMQAVPPQGLLELMSAMPLKDLLTLAQQLNGAQLRQVMETFSADPDLIPNLLASVDMNQVMAMVDAVPPELLLSLAESLDMGMVLGMMEQFLPKVKLLVLRKVDQVLYQLGSNSSLTFQQCLSDLGYLGHSMLNFSMWSFHFLDASGKPGRGMLQGNIHMIGNFDQCKAIRHVIEAGPGHGDVIAGSYCHVQFNVPLEALPPIPGGGILPMPEIAMDVCLPDTCRDFDLYDLLKTVRLPMNVTIPRVVCQQEMHLTDDISAVILCIVIAIMVLLVAMGTFVDLLFRQSNFCLIGGNGSSSGSHSGDDNHNHSKYSAARLSNGHSKNGSASANTEERMMEKQKMLLSPLEAKASAMMEMGEMKKDRGGGGEGVNDADSSLHSYEPEPSVTTPGSISVASDDRLWLQVARAFSLLHNLSVLLSCSSRNAERGCPQTIACLHGIRVLSMLWVIFASTVSFTALYFENLLAAANDLISINSQIILNSSLAQDTFFTISGVVTALTFLSAVKSSGGRLRVVHILRYYAHRIVRISPTYTMVLAMCALLIGYVADGPHWPPPLQSQCTSQWWMNMLFINNYFVSIENMCMAWTWFLANLMQFYWIAPLVLIPFTVSVYRIKLVGFVLIGLLVAVHMTMTIVMELDLNADILRRQTQYFWGIFQQPYCRVAPYALGLGLGFILTRIDFRFPMHRAIAVMGWILAFLTSSTLTLITYEENRYLLEDAAGWSLATRTVHETLQRPFWGLVVCWVIFACATNNGGLINRMLSWRGFLPLSRLTYCVYLVHPIIIICDLLAYRIFTYFTIAYVVFRYIGYAVVSYVVALVLSLLVETPVLNLEKVLVSACVGERKRKSEV